MIKNREVYQNDPASRKLVNEGVAHVNDDRSSMAFSVLRYELETFVCDGQYEKGMSHILETYLSNLSQAQQPGVWISGFFGSGKSHLVKVLRALWEDTVFEDGATARGIAELPVNIGDFLKELSNRAKPHGGLHAVSGTLGSGASGSVRLALLRLIFKSVGLPETFPVARFVMWLKREGIFEQVRSKVEELGLDWNEELDNFYVAEGLHQALVHIKPKLFSSQAACVETLNNLYPYVQDISNDQMIKEIRHALTRDGKFPLTLIVLDEVQQFIGESSQRSIEVQEVVESCCKTIGSKLLFIATGQTAVTGTSNLKKLEGRFTIRVELSDSDVEAVIRKVILAKKPEAAPAIEKIMQTNLGEISRHLSSTTIAHRQEDVRYFSPDYPILPVRRRFWEHTLRVLDQTGTESQLRNQLSIIHKAIQTNLDRAVGNFVCADYLYFDSADKLLQSRIVPRKVHELTMKWIKGSDDQKLTARACALVFLITKLAASNDEIGIRATTDTLADLLIEDIAAGSGGLRSKLPKLLDSCEILMKVGDEYRIQTEESAAWNDEFLNHRSTLANEAQRVETERDDRMRNKFGEIVRRLSLTQGISKVPRQVFPTFDVQLPADANEKVYVWIRDGWSSDENSVRADARQAGNQSSTVFVFIPKRSADDLRHNLIDFKAAGSTLGSRGVPNTPEGAEARAAVETIKQVAERKIDELLSEAFSGARVFQGGGNEIFGNDLQDMILEASGNALQRLYSQFPVADHNGWSKVYELAHKGAPDALKAVGDEGEPARNSVCKAILGFIGNGKNGSAIRANFESAPYGWSRDAIDGGLQVLLVAGLISASGLRDPRSLERKSIGKVDFRVESATVTTAQRIQIRKLFLKIGLELKQGDELSLAPQFIQKMIDLACKAGGEEPKPQTPDIKALEAIRSSSTGNNLLLSIYHQKDELTDKFHQWSKLAQGIEKRWPNWLKLRELVKHAKDVTNAEVYLSQVESIEQQRLLLVDPDQVTPLIGNVTQILRDELNKLKADWEREWSKGEAQLEADENWQKLEQEQRYDLRKPLGLTEGALPKIEVENTDAIIRTLNAVSLEALRDRIAAMPSRYSQISLGAAKLLEPKAQEVTLPYRTLKNESEMEEWIDQVRNQLREALKKGPVVIS